MIHKWNPVARFNKQSMGAFKLRHWACPLVAGKRLTFRWTLNKPNGDTIEFVSSLSVSAKLLTRWRQSDTINVEIRRFGDADRRLWLRLDMLNSATFPKERRSANVFRSAIYLKLAAVPCFATEWEFIVKERRPLNIMKNLDS